MMKNPRSARLAIEKAMPKSIPFDPRKTSLVTVTGNKTMKAEEIEFNDRVETEDVWHPERNALRDATRRALGFGNNKTTYQPIGSPTQTTTGPGRVVPTPDL